MPIDIEDLTPDQRHQMGDVIWTYLPHHQAPTRDQCQDIADRVIEFLSRTNPCPDCPEGELVDLGRRHPAADQVRCESCGFTS